MLTRLRLSGRCFPNRSTGPQLSKYKKRRRSSRCEIWILKGVEIWILKVVEIGVLKGVEIGALAKTP